MFLRWRRAVFTSLVSVWLTLWVVDASSQSLRITQVSLQASNELVLDWTGAPNQIYQVEGADRPTYQFTGITGAIGSQSPFASCTISISNQTSGFYRVKVLDPDAIGYTQRSQATNHVALGVISDWITNLKALGLFDNVVYMTTLRSSQNNGAGPIVYSLKGSNGTLGGTPLWTDEGIHFTGNQFIEFPNPFTTNSLSQFSIFCVFRSDQKPNRSIVGSWLFGSHGPVLIAGGSPYQGSERKEMYFDYTVDGTTTPWPPVSGRRAFNVSNAGNVQFTLATFSSTNISLQSNIDVRYQTAGSYANVWNGNPNWRMGSFLNGTWGFVGTICFVAIFDVPLTQQQYDQVRLLYQATLGRDLDYAPVNLVIEGDSLSAEGYGIDYGVQLLDQPNWSSKFNKHNVAEGGQGITQMLVDFPVQALPVTGEQGRNYLFLWAGTNDRHRPYQEVFDSLSAYWQMARAAGFRVAAFTILPTKYTTPEITGNVNSLNALIRSNASLFDYLIDVAAIPVLSDPNNIDYYKDGIHLTSAGYREVAQLINATIPNP